MLYVREITNWLGTADIQLGAVTSSKFVTRTQMALKSSEANEN